MNHLENHPHAFIDESGKVAQVLLFNSHDLGLLEQVKENFGFVEYKCCCDFGIAHINGDFYNNKFYQEKPYPSWIRNEELGIWEAPIPYPIFNKENPRDYIWNEEVVDWEEVSE